MTDLDWPPDAPEPMSEKPSEAPSHVTFRVTLRTGELSHRFMARPGAPSAVAKRDLFRYYEMLEELLVDVDLTESEAGLLTEAAVGLRDLAEPARSEIHKYLWAEVADSIREHRLGGTWGVEDPHALVERIRSLGRGEQRALIDALERFWAAQTDEPRDQAGTRELLREVGLVRGEDQGGQR